MLSSKFVPLLFAVLELSGAIKAQALDFHVGDPVDISGTGIEIGDIFTRSRPHDLTAKIDHIKRLDARHVEELAAREGLASRWF